MQGVTCQEEAKDGYALFRLPRHAARSIHRTHSYASLTNGHDGVRCPHCAKRHLLSEVKNWMTEPPVLKSRPLGTTVGG